MKWSPLNSGRGSMVNGPVSPVEKGTRLGQTDYSWTGHSTAPPILNQLSSQLTTSKIWNASIRNIDDVDRDRDKQYLKRIHACLWPFQDYISLLEAFLKNSGFQFIFQECLCYKATPDPERTAETTFHCWRHLGIVIRFFNFREMSDYSNP